MSRHPLRHLGRRRQRPARPRHRRRAASAAATPSAFLGHARQREASARRASRSRATRPRTAVLGADEQLPARRDRARSGTAASAATSLAELRRRPADVVVVDCMLFGAMARAATTPGCRYVVLEHLYDAYLRRRLAARARWAWGCGCKRLRPRRAWTARGADAGRLAARARPGAGAAAPQRRLHRARSVRRRARPAQPTSRPSWSASAPTTSRAWPRSCRTILDADRRARRPGRRHHRPGRRPGRAAPAANPRCTGSCRTTS